MQFFKRSPKMGCLGVKEDPRNYRRKFLFGSGDRPVPEYFLPAIEPDIKNQGQSMGCTFYSYFGQAVPIKVFKDTGEELIITNELLARLWEDGCKAGYGDPQKGAYVEDPCKFNNKNTIIFDTKSGKKLPVKCEKWFVVDDAEVSEEIYYGGAVLTGTSSRTGVSLKKAGSSPYFMEDKKEAVNDGHAHPQIAVKQQKRFNSVSRTWELVKAHIHPNSWGEKWGDKGKMYSGEEVQQKLFNRIGFVLSYGEEKPAASPFKDIDPKSWYYESIMKAVNKGVLEGYPDGTMRPGQPVTRAELAVILDRLKLL